MEEQEFQDSLKEKIYYEEGSEEYDEKIKGVSTFVESGVLTNNKGLVVSLDDGSEFQITIVKSK